MFALWLDEGRAVLLVQSNYGEEDNQGLGIQAPLSRMYYPRRVLRVTVDFPLSVGVRIFESSFGTAEPCL